jgi:flagellar basal body-associated protein FliL
MSKAIKYFVGFVIVAAIAAGAFYFGYWVKTPQYSLNVISNAVVNHDEETFAKHVDLDNLFSQLFDDCIAVQFHLDSTPSNNFLQRQVASIKNTVIPVFADMTKQVVKSGTITAAINSADSSAGPGGQLAEGMAVKLGIPYMIYKNVGEVVKTSDDEALVTLNIEDKQTGKSLPVKLRMTRLPDGSWQIKNIANVKEYLELRDAAIAAKLAELNKPLKDKIDAAVKVITTGAAAPKLSAQNLVEGLPVAGIGADFSVQNIGTKDILSVSGTIILKDASGTPRFEDGFEVGNIAAGKTIKAQNAWALNPFSSDQQQLAKEKPQNIQATFEITSVIFKDNTSITLMDRLPAQNTQTTNEGTAK